MTDPRPRPKYGEYAPLPPTAPEGVREPDAGTGASGSAAGSRVPPVEPPIVDSSLNAQYQRGAAAGLTGAGQPAVPERKQRMWDVFLTATLLLFGVVDVINTFGTLANLGPVLRQGLALQGYDSFAADQAAADAGAVANIVRIVALVVTIVFALIQVQRKRIAFWIPLVGAVVATLAILIAILFAALSDPGFMTYVDSLQR